MANFLDKDGLSHFWQKIKSWASANFLTKPTGTEGKLLGFTSDNSIGPVDNPVFLVTFTGTTGGKWGWEADKTVAEIGQAVENGCMVFAKVLDGDVFYIPLYSYYSTIVAFATYATPYYLSLILDNSGAVTYDRYNIDAGSISFTDYNHNLDSTDVASAIKEVNEKIDDKVVVVTVSNNVASESSTEIVSLLENGSAVFVQISYTGMPMYLPYLKSTPASVTFSQFIGDRTVQCVITGTSASTNAVYQQAGTVTFSSENMTAENVEEAIEEVNEKCSGGLTIEPFTLTDWWITNGVYQNCYKMGNVVHIELGTGNASFSASGDNPLYITTIPYPLPLDNDFSPVDRMVIGYTGDGNMIAGGWGLSGILTLYGLDDMMFWNISGAFRINFEYRLD